MKEKDKNMSISNSETEDIADYSNESVPEILDSYDEGLLEEVNDFNLYDSSWLKELDEDFLKAVPASNFLAKPLSICKKDNRSLIRDTTVSPWKMICKIYGTTNTGKRYMGTGFFISPRCIITSGHVVFPNKAWGKDLTVIPGLNGNIAPFGYEVSNNLKTVVGWKRYQNMEYDYGAIILPSNNLYSKVRAYFGFKMFTGLPNFNIAGYPGDKPKGTMWYDAGVVTKKTVRMFQYMIDTARGESGAACFVKKNIVGGVHGYGGCPNKAVRVNSNVMKNWFSWR